jgi:tRNA-guanine family transglycosylase
VSFCRWEARSLQQHLTDVKQQAMYAVIHGGVDQELRSMSAEYLSSLPFDGFAIGGRGLQSSTCELDISTFCVIPCVISLTKRFRLNWEVDEWKPLHGRPLLGLT